MPNRFQPKGNLVVLALLILTGSVGALFILLGPNATERSPGVLHIGIRYDDEAAMRFARYGKNGPGARLDFINAEGQPVYFVEKLNIGRNLVPIGPAKLPNGSYVARLQAPGYKPVDIPVMTEGRMLHPKEDTPLPDNVYGEYNLIGVRLESETPLR
ncbi:MAG: hypothetical protein CNE95_05250 [Puniceicoccaceae bacterium MED-G30]|jgi:hypothetical protein|nr:MAG: hypothetical protein CNE95_05250 [Puniceicoccaceae bacterium MED-G30]RPG84355.1 MAG: hypothetical protein CBC33_006620 [Coraliomargarita sp. TMED73]RPG86866.1 MAG: hypothetical protein CBC33_001370 [Coraliomargarita sp. TMED73]|tara:strand:- start:937 stop:1407 length:471 start_codon:yes stop_codon:yes gene_type:complete